MTDGTASEWATTDGAPDIATALTEIAARLDRIEAAVAERGVDARVVDMGDGTLLLHLEEPPAHLEHGQRLRVRLPAGPAPETADDQTD